ncbi:MAG: ribonucleoside-diphosphate reductase subunit alpha [Chryseobacterium sp.]|nr:MAG: ribonucleoside-diphosphate reductase subunit alpha [Chryseobacterium sp.]
MTYSNLRWLNEASQNFLDREYLIPGQSVEQRIKEIADRAEEILKIEGYSKKLEDYIRKGWISPSTPIWTNFGTKRGLPISCFGSYIPDSVEGILKSANEVGMMCKHGGGTSGYFGGVRPRGSVITNNGISNGTKPFLKYFEDTSQTISQGSVRRGYFSGYIDIDHADIDEWLQIRGEGDLIQHITWGVCVASNWIKEMKEGDPEKRKRWAKVIQKRFETGIPYIFFTDNANNHVSTPEVYKGKNLIKASQMCTEIFLPSNEEETFVCDLASMVVKYFEEWENTDAVEVAIYLLDAAMTEFIEKAENLYGFERAVKFAKRHRALGLGQMGYHTFLQSKMIPFEGLEARGWNIKIQKNIYEKAIEASKKLAILYGEPELLKGTGLRNTTVCAIAPNTSSGFIMQVSPGIQMETGNIFIKDLAKGKFVIKNKYLEELLIEKGQNTEEVWESIKINQGSVLQLDFLSDKEKLVFKTAREVSQKEVIIQAAHRQTYIDQGQSLNLFVQENISAKEANELLMLAHDMGLKSLYYQFNVNAAQQLTKKLATCASCES